MFFPCAQTEGFTRPSEVGPYEEKDAIYLFSSTAPTDNIESASAGAPRYFQLPFPSFPTELQTIIPFLAAIVAPIVDGFVLPSKSWYVWFWLVLLKTV